MKPSDRTEEQRQLFLVRQQAQQCSGQPVFSRHLAVLDTFWMSLRAMSLNGDLGEDDEGAGLGDNDGGACGQFLQTPELVEKLLPYLDLSSTKFLAESHQLTRQLLRKEVVWNKLIQRILPREERVTFDRPLWCAIAL